MFSSNTTQVSDGGYQISRSLRFNRSDSAYLTRTPSSTGSRTTFTLSLWIKLGNFTTGNDSFMWASGDASVGDAPALLWKTFDGTCSFVFNAGTSTDLKTSSVYRDPSAWYHVVVAVDTTQATASNRIKMYVNGTQITSFSASTYPSQNLTYNINTSSYPTYLGCLYAGGTIRFWEGYQTEVNFIDGSQLTPSSFGETNAQTGVWQPKAYSGSYGTNGFYLNFSDNSNTTAATLGKDYSGNGNNWTPNNFSVTAGAGNDSLVDSPTSYGTDTGVGGTVRGNYCTLNPLTTTSGTYAQGNLQYAGANSWRRSNATISRATGQWYWEVTLANAPYPIRANGEWNAFGFGLSTVFDSTTTPPLETDAVILTDSGYYKNFSGSYTDTGVAFASGDVLSIAVDLDANTFTFRRNNTSLATGTIGGTAGRELVPVILSYSNAYGLMDVNFGQRPFAYTAPSGFKALCTQNLPTPTIGATSTTTANKYFGAFTYTGNGSANSNTTQNITTPFYPDLTWVKGRSDGSFYHRLTSTGLTLPNYLSTNSSDAQGTGNDQISALASNYFQVKASGSGGTNQSGTTYVGWVWNANSGTTVTNTAGSITSTVSANTTSGFSIVTWTGNSADASIGHGLGVAPSMVIHKFRSTVSNWSVYTSTTGAGKRLKLNSTDAVATDGSFPTTPTSTVFYINGGSNDSGVTMVAYCFAPIAGYSAFGSYTGNGSTNGPFVYTGFKPAFLMIKRTDSSSNAWLMYDGTRNTSNLTNKKLAANLTVEENNGSDLGGDTLGVDFLSNGFKSINQTGVNQNASGGTYIYMAFAESPFKYSLAR